MKRTPQEKSSLRERFVHKKYIAVFVCGVLLVSIVGYVYWSVVVWQRAEASSRQARQDSKASVQFLRENKSNVNEITKRIETLSKTIGSVCYVPSLMAWQVHVVRHAKDTRDNCNKTHNELTEVRTALSAISARVRSEQDFARVMTTAQAALEKLPQDGYTAQRDTWVNCAAAIGRLTTHQSLKTTKDTAKNAVAEVVAAYDKLIVADKEQKRTEFDVAISEVEKAYSKLGAIQNTSVDSYAQLVDALDEVSAKL